MDDIIIGLAGTGLLTMMSALIALVLKLNSTMSRILEWMSNHEKQNEKQHDENLKKFDSIFRVINGRYWNKSQYDDDDG
jgi:hypothetical protein